MELIVAVQELARPGGPQTYALTVAEQLARLGHAVTLFARNRKPAPRPTRALLLGNYHGQPGSRAQILKDAWSPAGMHWEQVGYPNVSLDVTTAMDDVDIVVGYGRSIVEAMARGKLAYVFDHAGADGWVTPESYERVEAAGFSGMSAESPPDAARLRADLDAYRPELGRLGHDLVRTHHDARDHAAELVALLRRLGPEPPPLERSALRALALLCEAQLRAEIARDNNRQEAMQWFERAQALNAHLGVQVARLEAIRATRRYRFAEVLGRGAQLLRRVRGGAGRRRS